MPELGLLGLHVPAVGRSRRDFELPAFGHDQALLLGRAHLVGVVRHQLQAAHAKVEQDTCTDRVVAQVCGEAQLVVRLDRVVALVLQRIGADLVGEPDAAALVEHVDDRAAAFAVDLLHGQLELLATVAAGGAEHVAGQALRMQPDQHRLFGRDLALLHHDVQAGLELVRVDHQFELAEVPRRQDGLGLAPDLTLRAPPTHQVADAQDRDAVALRERLELGQPGHAAVFIHDLADHPGRRQAGQSSEVDGSLGVAGAGEHATGLRTQRLQPPRPDQVGGLARRVEHDLDRARTIVRRHAGTDALARIDRRCERGTELGGVRLVGGDQCEAEFSQPVFGEGQRHQAARLPRHEVDGLGGRMARRDVEIPFVLALFVIDQDHHLPVVYAGDDLVDEALGSRHGLFSLVHLVSVGRHGRISATSRGAGIQSGWCPARTRP